MQIGSIGPACFLSKVFAARKITEIFHRSLHKNMRAYYIISVLMKFLSVVRIVSSVNSSVEFYGKLLEIAPAYVGENFAEFRTEDGLVLGLWSRGEASPVTEHLGGGTEICLGVDSADASYAKVSSTLGAPEDLDFGRTFVVADPDGYRIRFIQEFVN